VSINSNFFSELLTNFNLSEGFHCTENCTTIAQVINNQNKSSAKGRTILNRYGYTAI